MNIQIYCDLIISLGKLYDINVYYDWDIVYNSVEVAYKRWGND